MAPHRERETFTEREDNVVRSTIWTETRLAPPGDDSQTAGRTVIDLTNDYHLSIRGVWEGGRSNSRKAKVIGREAERWLDDEMPTLLLAHLADQGYDVRTISTARTERHYTRSKS